MALRFIQFFITELLTRLRAFSSPEPTILLACSRNRELWERNHFEITKAITEFCPSGLTQPSSMAHPRNGCSQSSRFLPANCKPFKRINTAVSFAQFLGLTFSPRSIVLGSCDFSQVPHQNKLTAKAWMKSAQELGFIKLKQMKHNREGLNTRS